MLKLVTIVAYITVSVAKHCPNPESIAPCTCDAWDDYINTKDIHCGGNGEIDLKQVFKNISKELVDPNDRDFFTFYLTNTKVNELPENLFAESKFYQVVIHEAFNLTRVHSNAFNGTNDKLISVSISNSPLNNYGTDYDIFKALYSMPELNTITLSNTSLRHIPDNAFGPLNRLFTLEIVNGLLESVGKHAFRQLPNVLDISLNSNMINNISAGAFALDGARKLYRLGLQNNKLNNTNLNTEILQGLNTTGTSLNITGNQLTYIPENVFGSFMTNSQSNRIFSDNLDCTDCRNKWLVPKSLTYSSVMLKCSDHISFDDTRSHFANCPRF